MTHSDAPPPRRPRPTFQDWLLVAMSGVFVSVGLLMLPSERNTGIVTLAFFGSCLVFAVNTVVRKLRYRAFAAATVEVAGGVPIRPKRGFMILMAAWLLVLGIVLFVFGQAYPQLFRIIAVFIALAGGALLVATLTGIVSSGYLKFDPQGLTIAQRGWRAQIPWHAIVSVVEGDLQSNPVLLVSVADVMQLAVEPPSAREAAMKAIARTRGTMGADFAVMTAHYGIDLPTLAAAVTRFAMDASARAELRPRLDSAG